MNQYNNQYNNQDNQQEYYDEQEMKNNRIAGYMLAFFLLAIMGGMIYLVVLSDKSPGPAYIPETPLYAVDTHSWVSPTPVVVTSPSPSVSPLPSTTVSPPPSPSPSLSPSPEKTAPPPVSPSPLPPSPSPSPEAKIEFTPPPQDGPPEGVIPAMEDIMKDAKGKVDINVSTNQMPITVYLVDLKKDKYWILELKELGPERYFCTVPDGHYYIKFVKDGYLSFGGEMALDSNESGSVDIQAYLDKRPGIKIITKKPAEVLIDGKLAGRTPFEIQNLEVKEYSIILRRNGKNIKEFKVKTIPDKVIEKKIDI